MKNWIFRASTLAIAAGLAGSLACGGSSASCGGTNLNATSNTPSVTCGAGTQQSNGVCVSTGTNTTN